MLKIAIIVGEVSGDNLGISLMRAISNINNNVQFFGIGGQQMIDAGFDSIFPMEKLAVMGISEVLLKLPELLKLRKELAEELISRKPDVVVGIDAPDFNLGLEQKIKEHGIKTAHFVSPSVWAWRKGRIKKIKKAVDLMLTLFPFEEKLYKEKDINAKCVGHPLADEIFNNEISNNRKNKSEYLQELDLPIEHSGEIKNIAIMPGSRSSEISKLLEPFLDASDWLYENGVGDKDNLRFLIPLASDKSYAVVSDILQRRYDSESIKRYRLFNKNARSVLAVSDAALIASGTATLEAMLIGTPMVMAYKMSPISYWIINKLVTIDSYSLPNILNDNSDEKLVVELLQDEVTGERLGKELLLLLTSDDKRDAIKKKFEKISAELKKDAAKVAAESVIALVRE